MLINLCFGISIVLIVKHTQINTGNLPLKTALFIASHLYQYNFHPHECIFGSQTQGKDYNRTATEKRFHQHLFVQRHLCEVYEKAGTNDLKSNEGPFHVWSFCYVRAMKFGTWHWNYTKTKFSIEVELQWKNLLWNGPRDFLIKIDHLHAGLFWMIIGTPLPFLPFRDTEIPLTVKNSSLWKSMTCIYYIGFRSCLFKLHCVIYH